MREVLEIQSGRAALYGAAVVLCTAGFVGSTNAGVIFDFEGFANGQELGMGANAIQPYANFFTMSAFANGSPSLGAAIFDSSPLGPNVDTADQDLLVGLGNILILQNGNFPTQTVPGIFDTPNDEADGGTIVFDFVRPMMLLSIDLVDIDHNGPAELFLLDGSGRTRTYDVPMSWTRDVFAQGPNGFDTLDLMSLAPQLGEGGGTATAFQDLDFDPLDVVRLTVIHSGSAGLDNLVVIPAPPALALLALGLGLGRRRRTLQRPASGGE